MIRLLILPFILCAVIYAKQTMSQKSYEALMEVQELIDKDKISEAKVILNKLLEKKNEYTKSYAYQYLSNIALGDGDYKEVSNYYEKIIELNSFEKKSIDKIKESLAKIYLSLEDYDKTIKLSHELLKTPEIKKLGLYENLVYSYYYKKEFKKSIKYSNKYNTLSKDKKENIYQILYSSYIELKNHKKAISTLEIMVKKWYDKQAYWLQLISLYQETKQYKKALSTLELAYKEDILDPNKHTLFFANLLLQNKLYKKGSETLEYGIKNGFIKEEQNIFELLIASYLNAKEYDKLIDKLENSKFADSAKLKKILANLYYEKHDYKNAIKVLEKMHAKKHLDGNQSLILALAYFEIEDMNSCKINLQRALKDTKTKKRAKRIAKSLRINLDT